MQADVRFFFLSSMEQPSNNSIWPACIFELGLGGFGVLIAYVGGIWEPVRWNTIGVPYETSSLDDFGWHCLWGAIATLPMFAAVGILSRLPLASLKELSRLVDQEVRPMFAGQSIFALFVAALCAGIGEELLFRWMLQAGFTIALDFSGAAWVGLGIGAIIFGLMHWLTPAYAIIAGFIGAYLGIVMMLTGSLLSAIVAHALYDFVVLVYLVHFHRPTLESSSPT